MKSKLKKLEDFIKFFQKIPASRWTRCGKYTDGRGRCCAFGHLGVREGGDDTPESMQIQKFLSSIRLVDINDGDMWPEELGARPRSTKARVIRYLRSLKLKKLKAQEGARY